MEEWKSHRTLFLKVFDKECCNLRASKYPSILRLTDKNILDFTLIKFEKELKKRTPLILGHNSAIRANRNNLLKPKRCLCQYRVTRITRRGSYIQYYL